MLWEGGGDWAVGHVVKDPLTTGFGNPDYLEPPDSLTADQVTSQTASIEKPR